MVSMKCYDDSLVGMRPELIAPFLVSLFSRLDSENVQWAVMRGWERLPEWTRYDVDILVDRQDERMAVKTVQMVGNC